MIARAGEEATELECSAQFNPLVHHVDSGGVPDHVCALVHRWTAGLPLRPRDENDLTPLHRAVLVSADPVVIEALVEAGADVNVRDG